MPSAAALNYNYITKTSRATGCRDAAKRLISSGFEVHPHVGHCIKDCGLLESICGVVNLFIHGNNDRIKANYRNEVIQ